MPAEASAKRYAQAIFQIALEGNALDQWVDGLSFIETSLNNLQFLDILDAPQIPASEKITIAQNTLGKNVDPLAVNLVSLLSTRNMVSLIPTISKEYVALLDTHRGIERALVTTAVKINTDHLTKITKVLENATNNDYQRRGVISKGAILETSEGKCRVVSRPGQHGTVNAILVK